LRGHLYLIASRTNAHITALVASAAARRAGRAIRKIDQPTLWAGCGDAGPWW